MQAHHRLEALKPHGKGVQQAMEQIRLALENIRFGTIEIVIHDSKIVQIERREKIRFDRASE